MNDRIKKLQDAVAAFVKSRDANFTYAGDAIDTSSLEEAILADIVTNGPYSPKEKVEALARTLNPHESYSVAIFGVRRAIWAARTSSTIIFRSGVAALIAAEAQLDYRDSLRFSSIFENCAKRIGLSFQNEFDAIVDSYGDSSVRTRFGAFFSRSDEMRDIGGGIWAVGEGKRLTFVG